MFKLFDFISNMRIEVGGLYITTDKEYAYLSRR